MEYATIGLDFEVFDEPTNISILAYHNLHWYLGGRFSPREFFFLTNFAFLFAVYNPGVVLIPCSFIIINSAWQKELKRRVVYAEEKRLDSIQRGLDFDEARRIEYIQDMLSYKQWYDNDPSNWWRRLRDQILIDPYWNWIDPILRPIAKFINKYLLEPVLQALVYLFTGFSKLLSFIYEIISNIIFNVGTASWNNLLQPASIYLHNLDYLHIFSIIICIVFFILFLYLWSIRKLLIVRILILLFFLYQIINYFFM